MKQILNLRNRRPLRLNASIQGYISRRMATENVIVKSIFDVPELKTDLVKMSLPQFMLNRINQFNPNHVALVDGCNNISVTYGEMYSGVYNLAHAFRDCGFEKGAVIGVMSPNQVNYFSTVWAAGLNEYVSTTINHLYTEEELKFQLAHTRAKAIVAHTMCLEKATKVANELGISVIVMDGDTHPTYKTINSMIKSKQSVHTDNSIFRGTGKSNDRFDSNSTFILPFSSGTTGKPKGVMLSHRNIITNCLQTLVNDGKTLAADEQGDQRANICPLPYFHIYGNLCYNISMYSGGKHVFMMGFDLVRFLNLVQEHRVSKAFIVPPVILALAKHPIVDQYNLTSLKCVLSGAAPLSADVQSICEERLGVLVKQGWGMTELSPLGTGVPDEYLMENPNARQAIKQGSSGMVCANSEAKIVSIETGADLPHTETGEICIRGPMVMLGYFENKAATDAMIDKDGWLHTGDVGHISEDGFVFITDRCKELIKYKGFQVPPAELEGVIGSMKGVKDCVVIPVPCPEAGEVPRAYVVKQDDAVSQQLTAKEVEEFVRERVAPHKRLRGGVRFVETIPKSPSGKILRRLQVQMDRAQEAAVENK